jgi:hypothetical protein
MQASTVGIFLYPEDKIVPLRDYHATVDEKIIKYSGTLERNAA